MQCKEFIYCTIYYARCQESVQKCNGPLSIFQICPDKIGKVSGFLTLFGIYQDKHKNLRVVERGKSWYNERGFQTRGKILLQFLFPCDRGRRKMPYEYQSGNVRQ